MRVAVAGATGYIGGRLIPKLLDAGHAVRCLARSPKKLENRPWSGNPALEAVQADLEDPENLRQALQGCDAAYYLVHTMSSAGKAYARKDRQLAENFARAARAAGVGRIVYLGGLGETGKDLSEHLRSRREVEQVLASAGVPVTTLRAAMIIGSGSASFEILRYLVERLPVMITPKWVSTPCQPIAVRDVIHYLVEVLEVPETSGQTLDIGGADVMTYREIMQVMAQELGLSKRWVIPVPVLTPWLSSYWIHLVTPLSSSIARPLAEGLKNPVLCRDHRIREWIPRQTLSVREAIRAAIQRISEREVETHWAMAGPIPGDPNWAGGTVYRDKRQTRVAASPHATFRAICKVGGGNGWYAADGLWKLRGWIDRMFGGPGLRRGRRNPENVGYGEALDFWRVVGIEQDRRLTLRAEMKLPGTAVLEFRVRPSQDWPGESILEQEAIFQPKGLLGLLYWYAVLPFHGFVFRGMLAGIGREAVRTGAGEPVSV